MLLKSTCILLTVLNLTLEVKAALHLTEGTRHAVENVESDPVDCTRHLSPVSWFKVIRNFNHCYKKGFETFVFKLDKAGSWHHCHHVLDCEKSHPGKYLSRSSECNETKESCFEGHTGCVQPFNGTKKMSNCFFKEIKQAFPEYCSIGVEMSNCSKVSTIRRLPWIVGVDKKKHYVKSLRIVKHQVLDKEKSYWFDIKLENNNGDEGDEDYCSAHGKESCVTKWSSGHRKFRILDQSSETSLIQHENCSCPVLCYGYEDVALYHFLEKDNDEESCQECYATCNEKTIKITTQESGLKKIRSCGRHDCFQEETESKIVNMPRNFYQQIYDEDVRIRMQIVETGKVYHLKAECPLVDICDAMDCDLCWLRFINPSCYKWFNWAFSIGLIYIVLTTIGTSIIAIRPVFVIVYNACVYLGWFSWVLIKKVSRTFKAGARKTNNWAREEMKEEDNTYSNESLLPEPSSQPKKKLRPSTGSSKYLLSLTILTVLLLPTHIAPTNVCSTVVIENIDTLNCEEHDDKMECKVNSISKIPLISYEQTSCLTFLSEGGDVLGTMQVTPTQLHFKCSKVSMYYTRDYKMSFDYNIRCSGAGDCDPTWCKNYKEDTMVEDFPSREGPFTSMCLSGPACITNNCFFCTMSCHVIRYFPLALTNTAYEVFECSRWDPSATLYLEFKGSEQDFSSVVSMVHGETRTVKPGISISLNLNVQSKIPILSKQFLYDGDRMFLVDAAKKGQPVPGTIGSLQCNSKESAFRFKKEDCFYPSNICSCVTGTKYDSCSCVDVDISKIKSKQSRLPLALGPDWLEEERGVPQLQTSAFGSGEIKVQSELKMRGSHKKKEECKIQTEELHGCHSCTIGANLTYNCESVSPQVVVAHCDNDVNAILECSMDSSKRVARLHFPVPLIDINCKVDCQKEAFNVRGTLKSVGLAQVSSGSHFQISSTTSFSGVGDWLSSAWSFLGWWNLLWVTGVVIVIGLMVLWGIMKARRMLKTKLS